MSRLLKKDDESERILFEMFYQKVYQTAYLITRDHHLSQDVVQETFAKAFNQLHKLKNPEKTGAWLASIATNVSIDMIRKKNRWNDYATEDVYLDKEQLQSEVTLIEEEIERVFLIKSVRSYIANLELKYKQVIILKYLYDMKDEEIATALELKVGTVKSRIHRAKIQLRNMMTNDLEGNVREK